MKDNHRDNAEQNHQYGCPVCLTLNDMKQPNCRTCHRHLHLINSKSLQHTVALLITSILLYIPANLLPIMYTNWLGQKTESTILGGVISLWEPGTYPIAIVIFVASILVPIGKILALSWLCLSVTIKKSDSRRINVELYRLTELIGRWSMVDVFAVAILAALIQMGQVMSVFPGAAALAFAGMVITTMLAAMTFDPRLMWANQPHIFIKEN